MADATPKPAEEPKAAATIDELLTAEVTGSADSYQKTGQIFISVLAALPGVALLTSLVRAPGEAGLDEKALIFGVLAAVVAVGFGVALALRLRAPVTVAAAELERFDLRRILATNQEDYRGLLRRIDQLGDQVASITDPEERKPYERRLDAVLQTLRRVHLVATADELRRRVHARETIALAGAALLAAAVAVVGLALAPKPKADPATSPSLVQVALTEDGATRLGCSTRSFTALRLGGTDDAPQVLPLGVTCTAGRLLDLKVAEKDGLATTVEPVKSTDGS